MKVRELIAILSKLEREMGELEIVVRSNDDIYAPEYEPRIVYCDDYHNERVVIERDRRQTE